MKKRLAYLVLAAVVGGTAAIAAPPAWWKGSLTVHNESDYDIHHLFLAPAHKRKWGKDWLGKDVLEPGESFLITGLDCTDYDIKVVDEEGDECIVEDVDFCLEDLTWEVTNRELARCAGWSK